MVAGVWAICHVRVVRTMGVLISVAVLAWSYDHVLDIVVDRQVDSRLLDLHFLTTVHQGRFVDRLLWNRSWPVWTMMA